MRGVGDPADVRLVVIFLRSLASWNQAELAAATGIDKGLISDYEKGVRAPSQKNLGKIATRTGLSLDLARQLIGLFRSLRTIRDRKLHGGDAMALATRIAEGASALLLVNLLPALEELNLLGDPLREEDLLEEDGAS